MKFRKKQRAIVVELADQIKEFQENRRFSESFGSNEADIHVSPGRELQTEFETIESMDELPGESMDELPGESLSYVAEVEANGDEADVKEVKSMLDIIKTSVLLVLVMFSYQCINVAIGYAFASFYWEVNLKYDIIVDCDVRPSSTCLPEPQGHIQRATFFIVFNIMCLYSYVRYRVMLQEEPHKHMRKCNIIFALICSSLTSVGNYLLGHCTIISNSFRRLAWTIVHAIAYVNSWLVAKFLNQHRKRREVKQRSVFVVTVLCGLPWIIWNAYTLLVLYIVFPKYIELGRTDKVQQNIFTLIAVPITEVFVIQGVLVISKKLNEWFDVDNTYLLAEGPVKAYAHLWRTLVTGLGSISSIVMVSAVTSAVEVVSRRSAVWRGKKQRKLFGKCYKATSEEERKRFLRYYATLTLLRQSAEYLGIIVANLVVLDVQIRIIKVEPTEAVIYFFTSMGIQLAFEMIADVISFCLEERQGVPVLETWREIHKYIFFMFLYDVLWGATSIIQPSYAAVYANLCYGSQKCAPGWEHCAQ